VGIRKDEAPRAGMASGVIPRPSELTDVAESWVGPGRRVRGASSSRDGKCEDCPSLMVVVVDYGLRLPVSVAGTTGARAADEGAEIAKLRLRSMS